jgi:N-acetylneuraminate synthase
MTNSMNRTYIIAEAGVNHNGSLDMAKQLIEVAAQAGADAVKFQTFKSEHVITRHAPKAEYQEQTTGKVESQLEMVKKLELSAADHQVLIRHCEAQGIQFLSTPFDLPSLDLLVETFDVPRLKLPSGEITNAPLLLKAARSGKPIVMSTGMCTLGEVEQALGVLAFGYLNPSTAPSLTAFQEAFLSPEGQRILQERVTLLHCTTEYPAPFEDVNLRAMDTLGHAFGLSVGFSDHTTGIAVPVAAVARGAQVIEKHFTLDRSLPGPDHRASLEPAELEAMVCSIREVEAALGRSLKLPAPSELKNKPIGRKSLVAARAIQAGEVFTEANLTAKRPGTGLSPMHLWDLLGTWAERDYQEDEAIDHAGRL